MRAHAPSVVRAHRLMKVMSIYGHNESGGHVPIGYCRLPASVSRYVYVSVRTLTGTTKPNQTNQGVAVCAPRITS
jgi:hypothetical protein